MAIFQVEYVTPSELARKHGCSRQMIWMLLRKHPDAGRLAYRVTGRLSLYPVNILDDYAPSPRHQRAGQGRQKDAA